MARVLQKWIDPVREHLLEAIDSGALPTGSRLPTERELAARFGVSRAAVRQTMTILEAESRVVRQVGRGTFVAPSPAPAPQPATPRDTSPAKLLEARNVIEVKVVELVVLNATGRDLEQIARAAAALDGLEDPIAFERADAAFHRQIALATRNELLVAAYDVVDAARGDPEWIKLKLLKNRNAPGRRSAVVEEHARICAALVTRDAAAAAAAMRNHLLRVRANLLDV